MARRKGSRNYTPMQLLIGVIAIVVMIIIGSFHDIDILESLKIEPEVDSLENVERESKICL